MNESCHAEIRLCKTNFPCNSASMVLPVAYEQFNTTTGRSTSGFAIQCPLGEDSAALQVQLTRYDQVSRVCTSDCVMSYISIRHVTGMSLLRIGHPVSSRHDKEGRQVFLSV